MGLGGLFPYGLAGVLRVGEGDVCAVVGFSEQVSVLRYYVQGAVTREVERLLSRAVRVTVASGGVFFVVHVICVLR